MKNNIGLVDYVKKMIGTPYWWGTFGQFGTKALYDAKKKQYPYAYNWSYQNKMANMKVHDCSGLIKGYLWCETPLSSPNYVGSQDVNAAGFYMNSPQRGYVNDIPEIPGLLVFYGSLEHIGVYIGNGEVVQCANLDLGCIKTKLKSDSNWKYWGKCPWIEYVENGSNESDVDNEIKKLVNTMQDCLNRLMQLI